MPLDATVFAGPIVVTLVYILIYYAFIINVLRVKINKTRAAREQGERFDRYAGTDRELLAADRIQLNMLEHMPVFLVLLWLHAVFVSPLEATILGGIYTALRLAYPLALGGRMGRNIPVRILPITGGGYAVLIALVARIIGVL